MKNRDPIIAEFAVQVRQSGIRWDGLDEFLWWLLHKGAPGGFEALGPKIVRFGLPRRATRKAKSTSHKRAFKSTKIKNG